MDINEADFEKQRLRLIQNSGEPSAPSLHSGNVDEELTEIPTALETRLPSNPNPNGESESLKNATRVPVPSSSTTTLDNGKSQALDQALATTNCYTSIIRA